MKQKNKIILSIVIAIILIAGGVMVAIKGFNFDLKYQQSQKIQFTIGKTFETKEVKEMVKEVLGNQPIILQKIEIYEDAVSIQAKEITEEQKNEIITKINEKYGIEIEAQSVEILKVPHTRGRDLVKPYFIPVGIATIFILVYMMIRYHLLKKGNVLGITVGSILLMQALVFAIIAITRIPVGRLTIPIVLTTYVLTLMGCSTYFEKRLGQEKQEELEMKQENTENQ